MYNTLTTLGINNISIHGARITEQDNLTYEAMVLKKIAPDINIAINTNVILETVDEINANTIELRGKRKPNQTNKPSELFLKEKSGHFVEVVPKAQNNYKVYTNNVTTLNIGKVITAFCTHYNIELDNDDRALISLLIKKEYTLLKARLEKIYDVKKVQKEAILKKWLEVSQKNNVLVDIERSIESHETKIVDMHKMYASYTATLKDLYKKRKEFLDAKEQEGGRQKQLSEVLDYWFNKEEVLNLEVSGTKMFITILTTLRHYDQEGVQAFLRNGNRYTSNPKALQNIVKAVCVDKEYTLPILAHVEVDLVSGLLSARSLSTTSTAENQKALPNPHLLYANCFGGHQDIVKNLIKNNDYLMLIEQLTACVGNINFYDSVVIKRLNDRLLMGNLNYVELTNKKTDEKHNIKEFIV